MSLWRHNTATLTLIPLKYFITHDTNTTPTTATIAFKGVACVLTLFVMAFFALEALLYIPSSFAGIESDERTVIVVVDEGRWWQRSWATCK